MFWYYIVALMIFTVSITATLAWTFTAINSKYFLAYDITWLIHYMQSLWRALRWYRIRRLLLVLCGIQQETQYLNEIRELLQNYINEKVEYDTRKGMMHLSAAHSPTTTAAPSPATALTPPPLTGVGQQDYKEEAPLLEGSTHPMSRSAAEAAAEDAAATAAQMRDELMDCDYTFRRLSAQSYNIDFEQLLRLVPPRLFNHCGGMIFFTDLWRETVECLRDFKRTPEQADIQARRNCTKDLTVKVMEQELLKIEKLNTTICHLESHIANLRNALQAHNMSFVDDDE
ncbi:hypothetical protein STCU_10616 [Strigomonas culicis]|uniref:Uncharacterized protein n=1 Tax=Strigomonas culicis TaxID=28005 RepID=S9TKV1_9TRYP|nr:hypothetical protein STCU_10616 [Strigomonas culicis]|eukprot:EPY17439.1 hypothetical protein STCU_10616 [Strigomonas culicis]